MVTESESEMLLSGQNFVEFVQRFEPSTPQTWGAHFTTGLPSRFHEIIRSSNFVIFNAISYRNLPIGKLLFCSFIIKLALKNTKLIFFARTRRSTDKLYYPSNFIILDPIINFQATLLMNLKINVTVGSKNSLFYSLMIF